MQIRVSAIMGRFFALALVAVVGCGGDETQETSTSTSTSSSSSSSSSASSSSSSSGMGGMTIHNCTEALAEDQSGKTDVTITFTAGFAYTPPCVKVGKGTTVTFSGDFTTHPLVGGEYASGIATPDPLSPITQTDMGMSASFTFSEAGTFPFYCNFHASLDMFGVIYVTP